MDDDDVRRRIDGVETDVRSLRHAYATISAKVDRAQRTADNAISKMEESMKADVAEARRVDMLFAGQNAELSKQTRVLDRLDQAELRRATESMRVKAVREEDERKKADREKRIDRLLKLWPLIVTLVPALTWLAATAVAHWK